MDRRSRVLLAGLAIPTFTIGTDFTGALMLILPIEKEFRVDITTTQWVLNMYALTFAMGMVTAGRLADMFGRRRLLVIGAVVFVVGSIGCAAAPSIGWLIGARAVQGVGSSILWPCILGIASTSVEEDERGFAMGLLIGVIGFGNVIGPIFAGVVGGLGEWRLFYIANVVLGALSAILVPRLVPADAGTGRDEKIDFAGMVALSLALLCLLYALDVAADWGWGSPRVIGLLVLSMMLFVAFPYIEDRVADPLVPPPMMRNAQFLLALATNGLCIPAFFLLFLYCPQYLHKVLDWPVLTASMGTVPLMLVLAVLSVISGRLYNRVGPRRLLLVGYTLISLGALAIAFLTPDWGYAGLLPVLLILGLGAALIPGTAGAVAVGAVDPSRASLAGALSFVVHLAFGAVGVAAGTAILFATSAARLASGLSAAGVSLSSADQATLNSAAAGARATREILERFAPDTAERIIAVVKDSFVAGLNHAYWLAFALSAIGIVVVLCIREDELANVDK